MVSGACEVAALDLETLPRSEAGMVDAEFRLLVSTFGRCIENYHRVWVIFHGATKNAVWSPYSVSLLLRTHNDETAELKLLPPYFL